MAAAVVIGAGIYACVGVAFACALLWRGLAKLDSVAGHSGWQFRCMIFPGLVALWPLWVRRWLL
jgi:hypothetical protein